MQPDGTAFGAISDHSGFNIPVSIRSLDSNGEPNMAFSDDGEAVVVLHDDSVLLDIPRSGDRLILTVGRKDAYDVDLFAVALT